MKSFPPLTVDDYRNHPDLCKIIPPNDLCERNPDRLSLAELLERDGSLAASAARRAEQQRKAHEAAAK